MTSGVHLSRLTDLIFVMCTCKFLWNPEHLRQTNEPKEREAHLGVLLWQSAHSLFSTLRSKDSKTFIYTFMSIFELSNTFKKK